MLFRKKLLVATVAFAGLGSIGAVQAASLASANLDIRDFMWMVDVNGDNVYVDSSTMLNTADDRHQQRYR